MYVEKGSWVRIRDVVLKPEERSPHLPEDTKTVPLEMWTKGFLLKESQIGDVVEIETVTGRRVQGRLVEVNPYYEHDFGKFIPELLQIGLQLRKTLWEGEVHE